MRAHTRAHTRAPWRNDPGCAVRPRALCHGVLERPAPGGIIGGTPAGNPARPGGRADTCAVLGDGRPHGLVRRPARGRRGAAAVPVRPDRRDQRRRSGYGERRRRRRAAGECAALADRAGQPGRHAAVRDPAVYGGPAVRARTVYGTRAGRYWIPGRRWAPALAWPPAVHGPPAGPGSCRTRCVHSGSAHRDQGPSAARRPGRRGARARAGRPAARGARGRGARRAARDDAAAAAQPRGRPRATRRCRGHDGDDRDRADRRGHRGAGAR